MDKSKTSGDRSRPSATQKLRSSAPERSRQAKAEKPKPSVGKPKPSVEKPKPSLEKSKPSAEKRPAPADKTKTPVPDKTKIVPQAKKASIADKKVASPEKTKNPQSDVKEQGAEKPEQPAPAKVELVDDDDESSRSSESFEPLEAPVNRQTRKAKRLGQKTTVQYKYSYHLKEDHGLALFGASFNHYLKPPVCPIFATVGSNRVTAYKCLDDYSLAPEFVLADPDTEENFYAVTWSYLERIFVPVLAYAGHKGIIRVTYVFSERPMDTKTLTGHGSSVNDLKFHPKIPSLLFSASKDHGIRLWNIQTSALVAIFGGVEGHRDEVLGVDVHYSGMKFVSCGMDHSLKVWRLDVPKVRRAICDSFEYRIKKGRKPFETVSEHFPDFSTRDVHHNYIDCVAWHGDSVVSKSCEHDLKVWSPDPLKPNENDPLLMCEINVKNKKKKAKDINIWYLKFSFDFTHRLLAVGDGSCKTVLYEMEAQDPGTISNPSTTLTHPKCVSVVRVTAFSYDGDILITTCDDGSVFRWDRIKPGQQ